MQSDQQSGSQSLQSQGIPSVIQLTLLLSGGQQYLLAIEPDNPLLQQLYEVLVDWEGKRVRRLFQIPLDDGRSMLTFPCHHLVGLHTEPPLVVQAPPAPQQAPQQYANAAQSGRTSSAARSSAASSAAQSNPLVSEYIQLENFFTPEEHSRLLSYVFEQQSEFVSTRTSTGATNYRESVVLYSFPEFAELITQKIHAVFPDVMAKLKRPMFTIDQIESQLTAHNDGNFYKIHNDNGSPDTATRELTYVYYFYREPKAFSGGELVIYDSKIRDNYYVKAETFRTVEPINNSIVFFLSRYMHEVLPVQCPSQAFVDSRFTINGWLRRA